MERETFVVTQTEEAFELLRNYHLNNKEKIYDGVVVNNEISFV